MAKHTVVLCTYNSGYEASLEIRKLYELVADTVADSHGQARIIDESGEDYLYPKSFFTQVDLPDEIVNQVFDAA